MAVTTTYGWSSGRASGISNAFTLGDQFGPAVAGNVFGTSYIAAWIDPSNGTQVEGRILDVDQAPRTNEFTVNSTTNTGVQTDPNVAGLTGGNFVVTYTDFNADPAGDIRARLFSPTGSPVGPDFAIESSTADDTQSAVSELGGGGFVVTWTRDLGGGNFDILARTFTENGVPVSATLLVDVGGGSQNNPSVAGLKSTGFVAVWQDNVDGGVYFRRYDNDGIPQGGEVLIDNVGTNTDIHVTALAEGDGGFAVAYTDTGGGAGQDISFRIYNADGTARTAVIQANAGGITAGNQNLPTITAMGDLIVVGWVNEPTRVSLGQVFDATGNRLGGIEAFDSSVVENEFAGLAGGQLVNVWASDVAEGPGLGDSIRSEVLRFLRTQTGDAANDTITGVDDALNENLIGGAGNDILIGGAGGEILFGDSGTDTASYETAPSAVTANLANSSLNTGHAAGDGYSSIENLRGSAFADILFGNDGGNLVEGGAGADSIRGGGGADALGGGEGDDVVFGDDDDDNIGGNAGADILIGGNGADTMGGDDGDDAMAGEAGNDVMFGGAGNDGMSGGIGDDIMVGQDGADLMNGNDGNDNMNGGNGADIMIGETGNDTIGGGDDNDVLNGNEGDDTLFGEGGADQMAGVEGDDTMVGGSGDDVMGGGIGNDIMVGDDGNDGIFGEDGNDNMNGGAGNDVVLGGNGNDQIGGGAGADNLRGEAGNDTLFGESGDDFIIGGTGVDIIVSGSGDDQIVIAAGDGDDTLTDFTAGGAVDRLVLQGTGLNSFAAVLAAATQVDGNTKITYTGGSITLNGVAIAQLTGADFAFI